MIKDLQSSPGLPGPPKHARSRLGRPPADERTRSRTATLSERSAEGRSQEPPAPHRDIWAHACSGVCTRVRERAGQCLCAGAGVGQRGCHALTAACGQGDAGTWCEAARCQAAAGRLLGEWSPAAHVQTLVRASSLPAVAGTVLLHPKPGFDPHRGVLAARAAAVSLHHTQEHRWERNAAKCPPAPTCTLRPPARALPVVPEGTFLSPAFPRTRSGCRPPPASQRPWAVPRGRMLKRDELLRKKPAHQAKLAPG